MKKRLSLLLYAALCLILLPALADEAEAIVSGDYEYVLLEDGTAQITGYSGTADALEIPAELDGLRVTQIGKRAFSMADTLTGVTIPEGVTVIGDRAFAMCTALADVTIPDSVTVIGERAFYACEVLNGVTIPEGVTEIDKRAFAFCTKLSDVTLPDSLQRIGDGAFTDCWELNSIAIPGNVMEIGVNPFENCDSLSVIEVSPDNSALEFIDGMLFSVADHRLVCFPAAQPIKTCEIPEGTESIDAAAFSSCLTA